MPVVSVGFDYVVAAGVGVGVVVLVWLGGWPFQVGYEAVVAPVSGRLEITAIRVTTDGLVWLAEHGAGRTVVLSLANSTTRTDDGTHMGYDA